MGRAERRRAERRRAQRRRAERQRAERQQRRRTANPAAAARVPGTGRLPGGAPSAAPRGRVPYRKPPSAVTTTATLRATSVGCGALEDAEPPALGLTYRFESAEEGGPYPLTIRFEGRRVGVSGRAGSQDAFVADERIPCVIPGSGYVTVTSHVEGISPGNWEVTASPVLDTAIPMGTAARPIPSLASTSGATGFAPLLRVRAPGARIGAWPALVGLGAVTALTLQALLAARLSLPVMSVVLLSLLACLIGFVGAKVYYLAEHPPQQRGVVNMTAGMCIQGFVIAAIGTLVVGALVAGLSLGPLLDVAAPGLLFGMAIGRLGCFFGGCCAGRPTGSRWGLWSSDRRLGTRRFPTQLFESALASLIGSATLLVVWNWSARPAGIVFVAAVAAYTLGRQLLFPLRDLPRNTVHGRVLTMALAGLVLVTVLTIAALG